MSDVSLPPLVEGREQHDKPGKTRQYAVLINTPEKLAEFLQRFKNELTKDQVEAIGGLTRPGTKTDANPPAEHALLFALEGPDSAQLKPVRIFEGDAYYGNGASPGSFNAKTTLNLNSEGKPFAVKNHNSFELEYYGAEISTNGAKAMFENMAIADYGMVTPVPSKAAYAYAEHHGDLHPPATPGASGVSRRRG
jgi:hypothetical protein